MLHRLSRSCFRRRWLVLGAWLVVFVAMFGLNAAVGAKFLDEFDLPGSDSQEAVDILDEHGFSARAGFTGQLVFQADDVHDPAVRQGIERVLAQMEQVIAPGEIVSPYSAAGDGQINGDGTIAYAELNLADRDSDEYTEVGSRPGSTLRAGPCCWTTRTGGGGTVPPSSVAARRWNEPRARIGLGAYGLQAAIAVLEAKAAAAAL